MHSFLSSKINGVLSVNPSASVFVFGDFNLRHRLDELCYNCSISNDLTQMVNFLTWIPGCDSHSPALLDLFVSPDASSCSTMSFDHVVVSVFIEVWSSSKRDALFYCIAYDCLYTCADWDGLCNCCLATPRATLGHYQGGSLTDPMLITAFYIFDAKVTGSLVARLGP